MTMTSPRLSQEQTIRAAERWRWGWDTAAIGEALNVDEASVYNSLREVRKLAKVVML